MVAQTQSSARPRRRFGRGFWIRLIAATLAFSAEGIHLANLSDQQRVWWGYGLFFLVVAMAQGFLGVSLLFSRPGRLVAWTGIIGSGAVALTWLFTRIGGVPGIYTFNRLPIGDQGLAATLLEVGLMMVLGGYVLAGRTPGLKSEADS